MNLRKKIALNVSIIFISQGFIFLANFVSTIILIQSLQVKEYGIFSYGLVLVSYFAIIANFGMKPIILRELSREDGKESPLFFNAFILKLALTTLVWIATLLSAIIFFQNPLGKLTLIVLSFTLFFSSRIQAFRIIFEVYFHSKLNVTTPAIFQIADSLLLVLGLWCASYFSLDYIYFVLIYVLSAVPGFISITYLALKRNALRQKFNIQVMRKILTESIPLFIFIALITLFDRLDIMLLRYFIDYDAVAWYSGAYRLIVPLNILAIAFTNSIYPVLSRDRISNRQRLLMAFNLSAKILLLSGMILSFIFYFYGEKIILFFFSTKYLNSIAPFKVLAFSQIFSFLYLFLIDFNNSIDRQKRNVIIAATALCASFLANVILIPQLGIVGASWGRLTALFIACGVALWGLRDYISPSFIKALTKLSIPILFFIYFVASNQRFDLQFSFFFLAAFLIFIILSRYFDSTETAIFKSLIKIR